jgi:Virulence factor membrane-bound polymerase, C-terminal/O-Antigen ligase/Protein glycosylation ligase
MAPEPLRHENQRTGLGWALLALAFAAPWLVGFHGQPWTTFYNDWLMAAAAAPLALWAAWQHRGQSWAIDRLALGVLLLALVPLAQAAAGLLVFAQDGLLVTLQLVALAATIAVAQQGEGHAANRVGDTLFAGLLCAALLSTGLALYQRFELNFFGLLVQPLPLSNRPVANVGQPNNLATLLNWGLLALWWGFDRRRIGAAVAAFCACFLLLGVAATQSRTGIVCALLLAAAAVAFRRLDGRRLSVVAVCMLAVFFLGLVASWSIVAHDLMLEGGLTLGDQAAIGRRPQIWLHAVNAVLSQPWYGYGWNQGAIAQESIALQHPPLHLVVTYAHNLALDLMIWNGLPIGMVSFLALLAWFVARAKGLRNQGDAVAWLLPAVLLVHALVELPHAHMMFLVPAALSMGLLNRRVGAASSMLVPDVAVRVALAGLVAASLTIFLDYRRVETDLMALRLRAARIGDITPVPEPKVWTLGQLGALLRTLRTEPRASMGAAELDEVLRTASRYPSSRNLFQYAKAAALNGAPQDAARFMALLCSLHSDKVCREALAAWHATAEAEPLLTKVEIPAATR